MVSGVALGTSLTGVAYDGWANYERSDRSLYHWCCTSMADAANTFPDGGSGTYDAICWLCLSMDDLGVDMMAALCHVAGEARLCQMPILESLCGLVGSAGV